MSELVQNVQSMSLSRPQRDKIAMRLGELGGVRGRKLKRHQSQKKGETKGKLVELAWHLKKEGYSENTILTDIYMLKSLCKREANLMDPESFKETIANQNDWSQNTKVQAVAAYRAFAKLNGISRTPPKYKPTGKLPFISRESEIDALIAGCGKKTATILQLLKETGARIGEVLALKWTDIGMERRTVRINTAEKGGNPRIMKISPKLVAMINAYEKKAEKCLEEQKDEASQYASDNYGTKDILHVKKLLGHRNINNTLLYTQLVNFESDEYHSAVAETVEEARKLIEAGFEYVCTHDTKMLFRKRK